jgi:uncharacterized membrane protein
VKRILEIDALRGLALVSMVLFHAAMIAGIFELADFDLYSGVWRVLARLTQYVFLGLLGVSLVLSSRDYFGQVKRAVKILLLAFLPTIATFLLFGDEFVRFGILHFAAVAILLVRPFKGHAWFAIVAAVLVLLLKDWFFESIFFVLFYSPWDYFPLFPWLAVPLLGLAFAEFFGKRFSADFSCLSKLPILVWMGQRSLWIYLIHFPVLYVLFFLISKV